MCYLCTPQVLCLVKDLSIKLAKGQVIVTTLFALFSRGALHFQLESEFVMMGSYGRYDDRYGDRGGRSGGGGYGGGGYGGGGRGGGGRGNDLGADLHTIRWDLSTLPRFEKNFYREADSVRNRPDYEVFSVVLLIKASQVIEGKYP